MNFWRNWQKPKTFIDQLFSPVIAKIRICYENKGYRMKISKSYIIPNVWEMADLHIKSIYLFYRQSHFLHISPYTVFVRGVA